MRWKYYTETISGNWHVAVHVLNQHPDWDVIAMDFVGNNYTIVVYRLPLE